MHKNQLTNHIAVTDKIAEGNKMNLVRSMLHCKIGGSGFCTGCSVAANQTCARCGDFYCSKTCQIADWMRHRYVCFPMPDLVPSTMNHLNRVLSLNGNVGIQSLQTIQSNENCVELTEKNVYKWQKPGNNNNAARSNKENNTLVTNGEQQYKQGRQQQQQQHGRREQSLQQSPQHQGKREQSFEQPSQQQHGKREQQQPIQQQQQQHGKREQQKPLQQQQQQGRRNESFQQQPQQGRREYQQGGNREQASTEQQRRRQSGHNESPKQQQLQQQQPTSKRDTPQQQLQKPPNTTNPFKKDLEPKSNMLKSPKTQNMTKKIVKIVPFEGKNINVKILDNSCLASGAIGCIPIKSMNDFIRVQTYLTNYKPNAAPYKPTLNEFVLAKFENDWYRAKVLGIKDDNVFTVLYIDFTNEGDVEPEDIRAYPDDLNEDCYTALCLLQDLPDILNSNQLEALEKILPVYSDIHVELAVCSDDTASFINSSEVLRKMSDYNLL